MADFFALAELMYRNVETPFRVASISKWFTASLVSASGALDDRTRRLLSHTADLCPSSLDPLRWSHPSLGSRG